MNKEQEGTGVSQSNSDNTNKTWSPRTMDDFKKRFGQERHPLSEEFLEAMNDPKKVLDMGRKLGLID